MSRPSRSPQRLTHTGPMTENVLDALRAWVTRHSRLNPAGAVCPCCDQLAKVYRRKIHASMARDLLRTWQTPLGYHGDYFHVPSVLGHDGGDYAKLRHWGLIAPEPNPLRADGSTRTGWWRLTADGGDYVQGRMSVPLFAVLYAGRLVELDGPRMSIREALGSRFDYDELMEGWTWPNV